MAMMLITTSSSMSVKARWRRDNGRKGFLTRVRFEVVADERMQTTMHGERRQRGKVTIDPGSAGVPPAIFGVPPKTFRRPTGALRCDFDELSNQSAGRRL